MYAHCRTTVEKSATFGSGESCIPGYRPWLTGELQTLLTARNRPKQPTPRKKLRRTHGRSQATKLNNRNAANCHYTKCCLCKRSDFSCFRFGKASPAVWAVVWQPHLASAGFQHRVEWAENWVWGLASWLAFHRVAADTKSALINYGDWSTD